MENREKEIGNRWRQALPWFACGLLVLNLAFSGTGLWLQARSVNHSLPATPEEPATEVASMETIELFAELSDDGVVEEEEVEEEATSDFPPEETPGERIARSQEVIRERLDKMDQEVRATRQAADATATTCPAFVRTTNGMSLRSLALRYYGNEVFWVCIYDYNKDVLSTPDALPLGIRLALPQRADYGIDAGDPASLCRARALAKNLAR